MYFLHYPYKMYEIYDSSFLGRNVHGRAEVKCSDQEIGIGK
jgi:hypothetical protein